MKALKLFSILIIIILFSSPLWAQSPFQAGINFAVGFPQTEFKENLKSTGFGLSGHFCYQLPRTPVAVGAAVGFLIYGSETRREPLSTTIPDVVVDVETTNNIFLGHLLLRIQPPAQNRIQPYVEGLFGFNYLWTETSVKDWEWDDDEISSKNYDDAALSYGGGGGLMVRVYQGQKENSSGMYTINVDLGVRYVFGDEAKYLKKGDIHRENTTVTYHPSQSTTDLLTIQLGATFNF